MIAYADCLIDTTSTKFRTKVKEGYYRQLPNTWRNLPKKQLEALLEHFRRIRVVGYCSQDRSPRNHAMNIALLAAEVQNWEVFLRAHLDIMNDRFTRQTDGAYAWGDRKTYLRELEELDINISNLIMGITLRVEDNIENHYYSSVHRIGRALTDAQDRGAVEQAFLDLIRDKQLDLYNRALAYFVLDNYLYSLEDKEEKERFRQLLQRALRTLPKNLQNQVEF